MSQPLYVFDMDDTLFDADCAMLWNAFLVEEGIVTTPGFLEQDRQMMVRYTNGEMKMEDYLAFAMAPLAGMPKAQLAALVERCVDKHILPKLFPQAEALLRQLKQDGVTMVIISASVAFLVEAIARRIGIEHAIGINLVETEDSYTATIHGTPSYREGKVTCLEQWLLTRPEDYSEVHFYTDSINDLPLCLHADYAYLVNPCAQLVQHADRENWQVLNWG